MPVELPILAFETAKELRAWLSKNHSKSEGIWLRFYKKASTQASVTYVEAVEQALCFGWIDGQAKPRDKQSWLQRFTPRRARSSWSKINTDRALRLIESGQMRAAGLKQIQVAQADGRWKTAYSSPSRATIPADFLKALSKNKKAKTFFESLNKANLYAIAYRLETAKKPETRQRRMETILVMMARGEKFH